MFFLHYFIKQYYKKEYLCYKPYNIYEHVTDDRRTVYFLKTLFYKVLRIPFLLTY